MCVYVWCWARLRSGRRRGREGKEGIVNITIIPAQIEEFLQVVQQIISRYKHNIQITYTPKNNCTFVKHLCCRPLP